MIGAGIAGLAAAQQMQQFGMEVVVLEARVIILLLVMLKMKTQKEYTVFNNFNVSFFSFLNLCAEWSPKESDDIRNQMMHIYN